MGVLTVAMPLDDRLPEALANLLVVLYRLVKDNHQSSENVFNVRRVPVFEAFRRQMGAVNKILVEHTAQVVKVLEVDELVQLLVSFILVFVKENLVLQGHEVLGVDLLADFVLLELLPEELEQLIVVKVADILQIRHELLFLLDMLKDAG